jgi:ribosomal protein S4E
MSPMRAANRAAAGISGSTCGFGSFMEIISIESVKKFRLVPGKSKFFKVAGCTNGRANLRNGRP